jgi:hypothetical protein
MEDEVVRRRRWMTHQEFLDLLGATNLIPGPNSREMVEVSLQRKEAVIEYDDEKVTEAKLREVINGTGFKAVEEKPDSR